MKCGTKFLSVDSVSDKVVRYSLAYLIVQKWLVVDVPFYLKCWPKLTHRLQKRVYHRSASVRYDTSIN